MAQILSPRQEGNVLFLILIAVALFAALSYAVTKSTSGGGNADSEKLALTASKLEQIVSNVRVAITRLHISGCAYEDISFYSTLFSTPADFDNANTPVASSDFSCHVFHTNGGGVTWFGEDMADEICNSSGCGSVTVSFSGDFSIVNVGTSLPELTIIIDGMSEGLCTLFNSKIGISGTPPADTATAGSANYFKGTFDDSSPIIIGDDAAAFSGQDIGCYDEGSYYNFYATLAAR